MAFGTGREKFIPKHMEQLVESVSMLVPILNVFDPGAMQPQHIGFHNVGNKHIIARLFFPSPLMTGSSPFKSLSQNIATTPASPCGFCRGP